MTIRALALSLAVLVVGCAGRQVVIPNDNGRSVLCAERARAAIPSAWTVVEEIAAQSPYPTLTKAYMATSMYWPLGFGVGWLAVRDGKQKHYDAAFDRCLVETMPAAKQ